MNGDWHKVSQNISLSIDKNIKIIRKESVSGGCINQCWRLYDDKENKWFIKTNQRERLHMLTMEAKGLDEINQTREIRTPKPICSGKTDSFSYLVLEYIPLNSHINGAKTGVQLAKMHLHTSDTFGWTQNNTIGSTPQSNRQHSHWVDFWKNERLLFQLTLAQKKGLPHHIFNEGEKLANHLSVFFTNYQPKPSLLHGDLWSGNCASDEKQNPVIFDPAIYYGDREADLAMTELFGGFHTDFYDAYHATYPLDVGYRTRKTLYNLYHILNHYTLFGGAYASQAERMIQQLLAEV